MKTLGQIAFDSYKVGDNNAFEWMPDGERLRWEAAAQAVRADVLDEAAAFIEKRAMNGMPRGLFERGAMLLCATWCRQDIKDEK